MKETAAGPKYLAGHKQEVGGKKRRAIGHSHKIPWALGMREELALQCCPKRDDLFGEFPLSQSEQEAVQVCSLAKLWRQQLPMEPAH